MSHPTSKADASFSMQHEKKQEKKNEIYSSSHLPGYESIILFDASLYTTSKSSIVKRARKYICRKCYACSRPHCLMLSYRMSPQNPGPEKL